MYARAIFELRKRREVREGEIWRAVYVESSIATVVAARTEKVEVAVCGKRNRADAGGRFVEGFRAIEKHRKNGLHATKVVACLCHEQRWIKGGRIPERKRPVVYRERERIVGLRIGT